MLPLHTESGRAEKIFRIDDFERNSLAARPYHHVSLEGFLRTTHQYGGVYLSF
jgi:hypothetical protein